jgi:hypothetical protein
MASANLKFTYIAIKLQEKIEALFKWLATIFKLGMAVYDRTNMEYSISCK